MNAKVSIIIPVYNAEKTIGRTLDCLISQSYKNFEAICVNDGSKDNTLEVLLKYQNQDKRIRVFNQQNKGPAKTRHFALQQANGYYIMFCDADDFYEEKMIETMIKSIEETNTDIAMCDCNIFESIKNITHDATKNYVYLKLKGLQEVNTDTISKINTLLWNKIFKKEIIDKYNIQFPKQYEYDDDVFVFKYLSVANSYFGIDQKLYNYSIGNPNSVMGQVFTKKNKGRQFDFIYAFQDLYDFLYKNNIKQEYINFFLEKHFYKIKFFYNLLSCKDKKTCRKILFSFLNNNNKISTCKLFNNILETKNFKEFDAIFTYSQNKKRKTMLQKIFSATNDNNHKIINIAGIKLKFKYNKQKKPLKIIKKFILSYFLFPYYTYKTYKKVEKLSMIKNNNQPKKTAQQEPKQPPKAKIEIKELYSVPYVEPPSCYDKLICTTGFGHSGSGTVLDYLAEFSNVTAYGYHDTSSSGYKLKNDYGEIDIFHAAGSVMDMEKSFRYPNYFNDDLTIKYFLNLAEYFYRKGFIYTDYFWKITKEFVDKITDMKIKTDNGFEGLYFLQFLSAQKEYTNLKSPILKDAYQRDRYIYYLKNISASEYRKIAKDYIIKFLKSIESKEFLVCDQMMTLSKPDTERMTEYFGDFKQICVYRDPRDVYVTGIRKNESWMPKNPFDFVKWFYHRGAPEYLSAPEHPNRLTIRFEDFVLHYDDIAKQINEFVGLKQEDHIRKKEYFNPDVSIKNVGIHKTYERQDEIKYIREKLEKYCYTTD